MNLAPFSTWITPVEGQSPEEWQDEIDRLIFRQKAIDQFLSGEMPSDVFCDLLAEDGINPHEWVDASIANIEYLISL